MNPIDRLAEMMASIKTPASHLNDAQPSYDAEAMINKSGLRRESQKIVYRAVIKYNGLTSAELAVAANLDYHEVARRLSELSPFVVKGVIRECDVRDKDAVTWWLAQ